MRAWPGIPAISLVADAPLSRRRYPQSDPAIEFEIAKARKTAPARRVASDKQPIRERLTAQPEGRNLLRLARAINQFRPRFPRPYRMDHPSDKWRSDRPSALGNGSPAPARAASVWSRADH